MDNQIMLRVEGLEGRKAEQKLIREISTQPGIEAVTVSAEDGVVIVTGGDIDRLGIIDMVESMGYRMALG